MSVLLMRLAGPMQSWGTRSRFSNRDTGLEPSRSGVIGLLCAALGRPREAPLDDFLPLKMAVRVDREGRLMRDYHTAQNVRRADPSKSTQDTVLSERFYEALCRSPGEKMSVLAPLVGSTAHELNRPMLLLKRAGRIRSVGTKHATRYFPMAPRSA